MIRAPRVVWEHPDGSGVRVARNLKPGDTVDDAADAILDVRARLARAFTGDDAARAIASVRLDPPSHGVMLYLDEREAKL